HPRRAAQDRVEGFLGSDRSRHQLRLPRRRSQSAPQDLLLLVPQFEHPSPGPMRRPRMRKLTLLLALAASACSSGPKYTVDDKLLSSATTDEKKGMLTAQSDLNLARQEQVQAKSDLDACDRDRDISTNEYKTAKLQKDTAKLQLDGAKQSGDGNR